MEGVPEPAELERTHLFRGRPDPRRYARQHRSLVELLRRNVPRVIQLGDLFDGDEAFRAAGESPNLVFTRDTAITLPWSPRGYIRPHMREPIRRRETAILERALRRLGLAEIAHTPESIFLEGGDVVPFARGGQRTLLVGHGPRTSAEALDFLQEVLIPSHCDEIVGIELAPWRMNLDGGLLPVAEDVAVCDTSSIGRAVLIDRHGRSRVDVLAMIRELGFTLIDTTPEESVSLQSCNCVCLGRRRVVYYDLCARIGEELCRHGIEVLRVPGSELVKGRGGPRCMTRPVYADAPLEERRASSAAGARTAT